MSWRPQIPVLASMGGGADSTTAWDDMSIRFFADDCHDAQAAVLRQIRHPRGTARNSLKKKSRIRINVAWYAPVNRMPFGWHRMAPKGGRRNAGNGSLTPRVTANPARIASRCPRATGTERHDPAPRRTANPIGTSPLARAQAMPSGISAGRAASETPMRMTQCLPATARPDAVPGRPLPAIKLFTNSSGSPVQRSTSRPSPCGKRNPIRTPGFIVM